MIAERLKPEIVDQNRYPYAAIAEMTYGRKVSLLVTVLLDLSIFGGGVPNLLVGELYFSFSLSYFSNRTIIYLPASQNLQLLGSRISHGTFEFSFCYWLIIIGCLLCPLMWLGSPKNMKPLSSLSVSMCTSVALLTWLSIFYDNNLEDTSSSANDTTTLDTSKLKTYTEILTGQVLVKNYIPFAGMDLTPPPFLNLLKAYGVIAFQFDIHPLLLTIQVDMQDKRQIGRAAAYGILTTCTLSTITTLLAAYRYGIYTTSNVLEILPRSWDLYSVLLLVTFQLCLSSAIGNSALFQHIEEFFGIPREFSWKRCVIRSSLIGLAVFIGEILPRFDVVMSLIGGTITGPLIFILPPLFYTKILNMQRDANKPREREMNPMTIDGKQRRSYGTLSNLIPELKIIEEKSCWEKLCWIVVALRSDCVLSSAVILFGLAATFTSTYFNIIDGLDNFNDLWAPCILNISQKISDLDL